MNHKLVFIFSGMAAVCSLMFMNPDSTKAAASYFEVQKDNTPVYDNRRGTLDVVGYLTKGQDFKIKSDYGTNWWQIDFGGYNAYVAKINVFPVSSASYKNANTKYQNTYNKITAIKDAPVYDNTSGSLVKFAVIKQGQAYPILYTMGNWFAVDVDGRIGFVHHSAAAINKITSTAQSPSNNSSTKTSPTSSNTQNIYHTVQRGETLYRIASKYGVSVKSIQELNHLKTTNIHVGQKLLIKKGTTNTTTNNPSTNTSTPIPQPSTSKKIYIKAITDAPLYDNRRGTLDEIAKLIKGQELEVTKDYGTNWWQVKWGNNFAYVAKKTVQQIPSKSFKNANTSFKTTTKNIIPLRDAIPVYDNTSGKLVPFAILEENHRYPYISNIGGWWLIDIGGRYGYVHETKVKEDKGVPVLMYHHILDESELGAFKGKSTTITTEQFTEEIDYLHKQGFETITMADLEKYVKGQINLPAKTVAITFDDGLLSVRENAYPILKQYGMKATEFMITYRNNHPTEVFNPLRLQYFSKEDMENMKDVFDYQAHTHNLHNLNSQNKSDVVTKFYDVVKSDIQLNKNILNAHSFAYPFGQYNTDTIKILKELGFTSAVTTKTGYVNIGDDLYQLNRFGVYQHTSLNDFINIITP